ncbi:hypothetical protein [Streptomyces laurentii]|uniref:hypothetical protein n=1 Tax=Streptomyces laurentii TaxID=39478 RepID=UPI0033FFE82E
MTHSGQGPEQQYPAAQPLPPEVTPGGPSDAQSTQYLPPIPGAGAPPQPGYGYPHPHAAQAPQPGVPQHGAPQPGYGYPHPAAPADAQATQYISPVPGAPAPGADSQATQYLPPVPPAGADNQATQYLAPVPQQGPPPGHPQGPPPGAVPPPHGQQERPPLADFDNLFRNDAPQQAPQQAPQPQPGYGYPHPQAAPQQPQQQHGYGYPHPQAAPPQQQQPYGGYQDAYQDPHYAEPEPPRRKAPVKLIAAVVAGCAVVGLGAGALLSGGGDDKKNVAGKGDQNVAASSPVPPTGPGQAPAPEATVDPVKTQAAALDKLLADSNSSRDAVIRSVELIKKCDNLDQAAADLRAAAAQRRGLITRLKTLSVDKIPNNAALTDSLTRAWQASASADDYYAAWAVQAKTNHKVCKGGHVRPTSQSKAGDRKSGEATAAKKQASGLWNPTADKYQLSRREWSQL